jgi:hypothetical protein
MTALSTSLHENVLHNILGIPPVVKQNVTANPLDIKFFLYDKS